MTIIDAHQHVWDLTQREVYDWPDEGVPTINRTMTLAEIGPAMHRAGVGATVLVQAADHAADTAHMLAVADQHPEVVGVVGWVPLDEPARAAEQLESLRQQPILVGIRALIHTMSDPDWILRADVGESLGMLEAADLSYDFVTSDPTALAHVPTLGQRHPGLRIVIDHLGKPPIGGDAAARKAWRDAITAAAENPLVHAKVSGLYPAVGAMDDWSVDTIRPFVDDALDVFGPSRLLAGGDWPVSELAGGYERTWSAIITIADELDPGARDAILGGTAAQFYRIPEERLARACGF